MTRIYPAAIFLATAIFVISGCDRDGSTQGRGVATEKAADRHGHPADEPAGHDHPAHAHENDEHGAASDHPANADEHDEHATGHDHPAHAHEHDGPGDLDRSIPELLEMDCEHGIKAVNCDECRYESGFVKVDPDLFEKGLMKTVTAEETTIASGMTLYGETRLSERRIARLSPRTSGQVASVGVAPGDHVRRGQVLVEIESTAFAGAAAEWLAAEATFRLADISARRHQDLNRQGLNSTREFQEAQSAVEAARIRLDAAALGLKAAGMTRADARALSSGARNRVAIRAPFDGEVFEVNATRGAFIEPGQETVVMGDRGTLEVMVDLRESDLETVSTAFGPSGIPASVTVAAWPGRSFSGILDLIEPTMSRQTRTIRARVTVTNDGLLLRPGMFATVRPQIRGDGVLAITVPAEAVLTDEGRQFVFVHHDGPLFMRRPVKAGKPENGIVEVTSGLAPGQTVVTTGAFLLKSDVLKAKMGEGCAH